MKTETFNLGDRVTGGAPLRRHRQIKTAGDGWRNEWRASPRGKPVSGIYVGRRTYRNGAIFYNDDYGATFAGDESLSVGLIVPSERENPIPVLFETIEALG
jgi:hypothetical protein